MREGCLALAVGLLMGGCGTGEKLPEQRPADDVKVTTLAGYPKLQLREIKDKDRIAALVAFVNSRQGGWSIPWYGASVGRVYFEFISAHRDVGIFCVGPNFFGRTTDKPYTQDADRKAIEELGRIVDTDLWAYVSAETPGPVAGPGMPTVRPADTAAVTPAVTPTAAPAAPAAAQPTRHP